MFAVKTDKEIAAMREGGKILAHILRELASMIKPGVTTAQLNALAERRIMERGVKPSFLGYRNYPAVLCTSVNDQAVHSVPSDYIIMEGDLVKLDFGIIHKGLHTDAAVTVLASIHSPLVLKFKKKYSLMRKLSRATREALEKGIAQCRAGNTVGDIGHAIQSHVEANGFKILRELGGHGVGRVLHEEPFIPNIGRPGTGEKLPAGATVALEPITAVGTDKVKDGPDGFTYETKDGSLSAHFEHTVAITDKGPVILTA